MSSAAVSSHAAVHRRDDLSAPMSAQHAFTSQYDLDKPSVSMSLYARVMHEHTKHQLESATDSARRRSQGANGDTLSAETAADPSAPPRHSIGR